VSITTPVYAYGDPTIIPRLFAEHMINTGVPTTLTKTYLSNAISEVTVETQTAGPALLQLTIIDPDWSVIRSGLFNKDSNGLLQAIDINFPEGTDVWWRLAMVEPTSVSPGSNTPNFTVSFQHRFIAQLMQCYGPLGWPAGKIGSTRAQFIRMLLRKLETELPASLRGPGFTVPTLICPAINEVQPVASSNIYGTEVVTEASAAARAAGINKLPGLTKATAITVEGSKPSSSQLANINTILGVGTALKASTTAMCAALYAAIGESSLTIVKSGDGGSQGVFQSGGGSLGNPYSAGQDLAAQATGFFSGGVDFQGGGAIALANKGLPIWKIANAVEANQIYDDSGKDSYTTRPSPAWPSIAVGEAEVTAIVNGYNGGTAGVTSQAESDVAQLTRGTSDDPDEDSWTCMQRLASEVNWMIFSSPQPHLGEWGNYLYYLDGVTAVAQQPSLYLELSDAGDVWSAIDPSTGKALTGDSDGMAFSITGTVDNTAFQIEQTAASAAASGAKAGGAKVQKTTRIQTPETPSQMMFNLIAGAMEFNAGDVFVVRNAGPLDGRWIVEDVTHNCLALDTRIPTPDGWKTMRELETGDKVFGSFGNVVNVTGVSPVHVGRECFRVHFNDGTSIVTDESHLWETASLGVMGSHLRTTREIAETLTVGTKHDHNHHIKLAAPLDLPKVDLPINPYILGYWLGDGVATAPRLAVGTGDAEHIFSEIKRAGYSHYSREVISATGFAPGKPWWSITLCPSLEYRRATRGQDCMRRRLMELGVFGSKHIPLLYLRGSTAQRLALLQGLMDSDGTINNARCALRLNDERLARDALELVRSLGFRPHWASRVRPSKKKLTHSVEFSARAHAVVFRMPRKANKYMAAVAGRGQRDRTWFRTIVDAECVESIPVKCITVDALDHLFLAGDGMIPTHNTLGDLFAQFTLGPSIYSYPEPQANTVLLTGTNGNAVSVSTKTAASPGLKPAAVTGVDQNALGGVAQAAQLALSDQIKSGRTLYEYSEQVGSARQSGGGLFGSSHPRTMDCSKFATLCYQAAGLADPNHFNYVPIGNTTSLIAHCTPVSEGDARPGDLCFFGSGSNGSYVTEHVNVYIGNGQSISMGTQGDPSQGPSAVMGPSGFLGWFRSDVAPTMAGATSPAITDPLSPQIGTPGAGVPGIFGSVFKK
jgi:cell wall-associated NlpC family hydrolase